MSVIESYPIYFNISVYGRLELSLFPTLLFTAIIITKIIYVHIIIYQTIGDEIKGIRCSTICGYNSMIRRKMVTYSTFFSFILRSFRSLTYLKRRPYLIVIA